MTKIILTKNKEEEEKKQNLSTFTYICIKNVKVNPSINC